MSAALLPRPLPLVRSPRREGGPQRREAWAQAARPLVRPVLQGSRRIVWAVLSPSLS